MKRIDWFLMTSLPFVLIGICYQWALDGFLTGRQFYRNQRELSDGAKT